MQYIQKLTKKALQALPQSFGIITLQHYRWAISESKVGEPNLRMQLCLYHSKKKAVGNVTVHLAGMFPV